MQTAWPPVGYFNRSLFENNVFIVGMKSKLHLHPGHRSGSGLCGKTPRISSLMGTDILQNTDKKTSNEGSIQGWLRWSTTEFLILHKDIW